jgi:hypothetical protein
MFRVLGLITYVNEIPIIQISYLILKFQYPTHKGLADSWNDMDQVGRLSNYQFSNKSRIDE